MDITLKRLCSWHPEWEWRAVRTGFGWEYVGNRTFAEVRVRAYSVLCGPSEDDCATQWRVEQGEHSESFAMWSLTHMVAISSPPNQQLKEET
jgi:hypothetical protein